MPIPAAAPETLLVRVELAIGGERVHKELEIPKGPTRPARMLPVFQAFADEVVGRAAKAAEAEGKAISCRAGCGACCRQLVPISETEARRLGELVEAMPAPRREAVRARFTEARRSLEAQGVWTRLLAWRSLDEEAMERLGLDYFHAGVACPFLEAESCSIHPDRPLSCREFLVTSPAENCNNPTPETIAPVAIPGHASDALARLDESPEPRAVFWVPLVFALSFAEENPDMYPSRPGLEWLNAFLGLLSALSEPEEVQRPKPKPKAKRGGKKKQRR